MSPSTGAPRACSMRAARSRCASSGAVATWPRLEVRASTSACARSLAASPPCADRGSVGSAWYHPGMLHELRVENLLLLERAELALTPGLNGVTGETGAGKTLLAQSLDLLLGGRARAGLVRAGAAEAYVEGVVSLPAALTDLNAIPPDAEESVLAPR